MSRLRLSRPSRHRVCLPLLVLALLWPLAAPAATLTLAWDGAYAADVSFVVQRQLPGTAWTPVATVPAPAGPTTQWSDTALPEPTRPYTVRYRVVAQRTPGGQDTSAPSNELVVSLGGAPRLPQSQLKALAVDSTQTVWEASPKEYAVDGNPRTFWHSQWSPPPALKHPHWLVLDLGKTLGVDGLAYLPRQDDTTDYNGTISQYEIAVSDDPQQWGTPVASGTWQWPPFGEQIVRFPVTAGRYVRLRSLSEWKGKDWAAVAEVGIYAAPLPPVVVPHVGTPQGLTATALGLGVRLAWQAPVPLATDLPPTGYHVQRRTGTSGVWTDTGQTGAAVLTLTDSAVVAAQPYSYRVQAWAAHPQSGQTVWSDPCAEATITLPTPVVGPVVCATESYDGKTLKVTCTMP